MSPVEAVKGAAHSALHRRLGGLAEARLGGMASPSLVKQWTKTSTPMANARQSPVSEPRRSPRLSGGGKGVLTATSANKVVKRSPARRSSLLVGGKRSLEARPTPEVEEDELPEEMQFASDSPAMKKARPSDAKRMSRVSFGGVELLRYDKNQKGLTPARRSSTEPKQAEVDQPTPTGVSTVTEVSEASDLSMSSAEEGFFSPSKGSSDEDVTEKVPTLKDLMAEEVTEMQGYTGKLSMGDQTAPTPRLSDLGNFDNTESIQQRTSSMGSMGSMGLRESMAPNTDTIAANMLSRPSMAPHAMGLADTPTASGPSLANLVKRAQGELDESQATGSIQDTSSPDNSDDDLDGSMEMTECYGGGIVQSSQSSPARPPVPVSPALAAASMTTLNVKPPQSPNLKKLLRERGSAREDEITSSPAPASPASSRRLSSIGTKIPTSMTVSPIASSELKPRTSTTPQAMNRRKGASMLAATEDFAPPSPVSGAAAPQPASPALMRAGSRITMTESGTKPSPNPPQSPCRPSPMKVSPAQAARPMPSFVPMEEEESASFPALTADQHADEVLGSFEEEESLQMADDIPDTQTASPVPAIQATRQSAGVNLKQELKRRSMAHAGQVPFIQAPDTTRSSSSKVVCKSMKQFLAISDIRFLEDMSVNRRDTLCVRPGANKAQDCGLGEAIALSTTALPELRVMQEACDTLTTKITQSQAEVAKAENAAELNPPALFQELSSDTRSEVATVIRGKLKTLKQTCRKQAKLEWYEWFKSIVGQVLQEAQGEIDRLTKEESDLVTRAGQYDDCEQKLHEYLSSLGVQPLAGRQLLRTNSEFDEANALEKATAAGAFSQTHGRILTVILHTNRYRVFGRSARSDSAGGAGSQATRRLRRIAEPQRRADALC